MTKEENIATLNEHLEHWKRLLSEKICDQSEGEKTIDALQNAIKALEQEPCEDAVSRRAVNEIINDAYYLKLDDGAALQESIHQLPSVTPQQKMGSSSENPNKWIPVSERLPEEAGMYLCSYDDDDVGTSYFDIRMNEFNIFHEQVAAWMPLPEPYKQEVDK